MDIARGLQPWHRHPACVRTTPENLHRRDAALLRSSVFGGTGRGGQTGAWASLKFCAQARLGEPSYQDFNRAAGRLCHGSLRDRDSFGIWRLPRAFWDLAHALPRTPTIHVYAHPARAEHAP